jgi:hypothetical protein
VLKRCVGVALIGLPRWILSAPDGQVHLPTEFCHYEGAVAYTFRLSMLVFAQENLMRRVVFDWSFDGYVGVFPETADQSWCNTDQFRVPFGFWRRQLDHRRDVFLGYCSSSGATAAKLKRYLEKVLGVTVLDWQTDFAPGRNILEQITEASLRCTAGIFLFTKDDNLLDDSQPDKAVPRDNVVFEAGYFISSKGKDHVLIVRESGAKMPADLGGDIYAALEDKTDIRPVEDSIRRFITAL